MPLLFLSSDARILDLIRKGDETALVELFEANRTMVTSFVTGNRGTEDDAADLLQEAVVVLWERVRARKFEHKAKLSTFIFSVAKNLWMRRLARRKREIPSDLAEEVAADPDPSVLETMMEEEEVEAVRRAIRLLDEVCRKLLLMIYWEELPPAEVAAQMGFANANVVKSKKYQCKKNLEALLRADPR